MALDSLEQSLKAYRAQNTPTKFSWKQHWVNEVFSSDDLLECSPEEQEQFYKRLYEGQVLICNGVHATDGKVGTLKNVIDILTSPKNKKVIKTNRKMVYNTAEPIRPTGENAFNIWNGLQVIDMDIKNRDIAIALKYHIFNKLYKCNWFLGVAFSSSGAGLHIYTKISTGELDEDTRKNRILYLTNFRHKFSFVYIACLSACEKIGFTKEQLMSWLDFSMRKVQQGAFIGYDEHPLINTHFFEDFIYVNFDNIEALGHPDMDWATHPDLAAEFKRWETGEEESKIQINVLDSPEHENGIGYGTKVHYKHNERWRLANTLVFLYGKIKGCQYMRMICSNDIKDKEIQADCNTAAFHKKPADPWAVNRLNNQHGFKIKLDVQEDEVTEADLYKSVYKIENPTLIKESENLKTYHLTKDQYLGDIYKDLLNDIGMVTLIEAGAGVGKTEMVKKIVRDGKKVVMVMPFTSTIKSKVENDPDWYYSYGNRNPRLDVQKGLSMTIDKFSRLNLMDIKTSGFDYIFIDESHLLFQSEYRPVMSKVVEMIRNTEVPIILMSGTPSGELVFFENIVHLKIDKDDVRKKEFKVNMVETSSDLMFHMCRQMANDIINGKRILFPTNSGTLYSKQVKAGVTFFLQNDHQCFDEVNLKYYKKSNLGEEIMDKVNFEKTIDNTQILMCTNYLSVGVDILDKFNFSIYFADLMMPQEVEQFANRLRSNDLFINLYVAKNDAEGNSRHIDKYKGMNLKPNEDEIKDVQSVLAICNNALLRNTNEYKYNTLVASFVHNNPYVKYDEVDNKYYLNTTAYHVVTFERKYREYVQQLPVLMRGMQAYGYLVSSKDLKNPSEFGAAIFKNMHDMVKLAYDEQLELNTKYIEELIDNITEQNLNEYKACISDNYTFKKGQEWNIDIMEKEVTAKSIEVFEKVVPIFNSMSKQYAVEDIKDIFEFCRNKNKSFNFAAINRMRMLSNIVFNNKHQRLDIPIKEFMCDAYDFADKELSTKAELAEFINKEVEKYADLESGDVLKINKSIITINHMIDIFEKIFKCLVNVSRPKKDGSITMHRVEMMWKEKEYYNNIDLNEKVYIIEEFLDLMDKDGK